MSRFPFASLDLSLVPPPQVVQPVDYETIRAVRIAELTARFAAAGVPFDVGAIESDPSVIHQEEDAYREMLESGFVLADHRRLRDAPHLVMGDLAQRGLPAVACGVMEDLFTVRNPEPKQGVRRIVRNRMRRNGIRVRDAVREGLRAVRTFG